jgi:hypothetical protein
MANFRLASAPSGLVHLARILPHDRAITNCGREVNWDTWTRIDMDIHGLMPSTIKRKLELPTCERCLPPNRKEG